MRTIMQNDALNYLKMLYFKGDNQKLLYNTTTGRFKIFLRTEGVLETKLFF